ncbi:MAG: pyridoxamine 5'-phosphate oxidase family protein [Beijerinckiaceae bacterium]|jgi:heme iron utilization protein|nr:pyridoxamine 5'-phosphate oxidase family protein [Beijerinckiaceae bacterium]
MTALETPAMPEPERSFELPAGYDGRAEARRLLRSIRAGALATLDPGGAPFCSLVNLATDADGSPLLLMSQLSAHTRHLGADGRASILLAENGKGDPLAHPRLTLTGRATRLDEPRRSLARTRFLSRHPKSALYADFGDFSFWRLDVDRGHLNGGFAKAATYEKAELMLDTAGAEDLMASEEGALAHLNADHADALALYAAKLCGAGEGRWRASGLDPEGLDLACGDRTARLVFPIRVETSSGLRAVLVDLAAKARTS